MKINRFTETLPTLRRIWSPSTLADYMACPRRHWHRNVERISPNGSGKGNIDRKFGDFIAKGTHIYTLVRGNGGGHEEAVEEAVGYLLALTWPRRSVIDRAVANSPPPFDDVGSDLEGFLDEPPQPWGGRYVSVWQCLDPAQIPQKKDPNKLTANRNRCERAKQLNTGLPQHLGQPGLVVDQDYCDKCRGPVKSWTTYIPTDPTKNRRTLIRALIAYCDAVENQIPVTMADGRVGSEITLVMENLGPLTPDGNHYIRQGILDKIVWDGGALIFPELKTTRRNPNSYYWSQFQPSVQILEYNALGQNEFGQGKVRVVVMYVGANFTEVYHENIYVSPAAMAEWDLDVQYWVGRAREDAETARDLSLQGKDPKEAYRRNLTSCGHLPGAPNTPCPYQRLCSLSPADRDAEQRSHFHVRPNKPDTDHEPAIFEEFK